MCLAKDHNAVTPVRLEPAAPRSRVKHSTTEPLRSLNVKILFANKLRGDLITFSTEKYILLNFYLAIFIGIYSLRLIQVLSYNKDGIVHYMS